jgi:hypothetical protein
MESSSGTTFESVVVFSVQRPHRLIHRLLIAMSKVGPSQTPGLSEWLMVRGGCNGQDPLLLI